MEREELMKAILKILETLTTEELDLVWRAARRLAA